MEHEIEKCCKFCEMSEKLYNTETVLCKKHGVVPASHVCRKFSYDPLKREPRRRTEKPQLEYVEL